jgi:hypothetical protein
MVAKFAEVGRLLLQRERQVFLVFVPLGEAWRNMYDERTRLVFVTWNHCWRCTDSGWRYLHCIYEHGLDL